MKLSRYEQETIILYNQAEATAEVLKDGWLYTGDMAMQDADGFYFLVDRKKDVVVSGGENIYPVQIEDFLRTNDKIKDVAVIGLPDKRLGEICGAVIELKPGASQAGHDLHRERDQAVLYGSAPVQAPPEDHLRRDPPQRHRQDRKARPAQALRGRAPGGPAEPELRQRHTPQGGKCHAESKKERAQPGSI